MAEDGDFVAARVGAAACGITLPMTRQTVKGLRAGNMTADGVGSEGISELG